MISVINVELTSRCNKNCWMCGRRKWERDHPGIDFQAGDMDLELVGTIASQLPQGIIVQLHNNGESTLYPQLGEAIDLFHRQITNFDTNGKLLLERADEIIGRLDTLTISVIENDPEGDAQYDTVTRFLQYKKDTKPFVVYRLLGDVGYLNGLHQKERKERWYRLPGLVATRILHSPAGSFDYTKKVTIPEHGICLDLLCHVAIDRWGNVYPCVRYDPTRINLLGNIRFLTLEQILNGEKRLNLIREHIKGNRDCSALCSKCSFYGVPTGG